MWHFQHHHHTITIQVFHKHYYDDKAQVKCSLSRSDGDSNRFLTSWWFYSPHKPHSLIKWATGHHITLSRTNSRVRQAPPVPEDRSSDQGIQGIPGLCNTLGVKHALSLIKVNHKHHEHVILLRIWFYVHHFMCFKYVKNMMLASKIVKYSN